MPITNNKTAQRHTKSMSANAPHDNCVVFDSGLNCGDAWSCSGSGLVGAGTRTTGGGKSGFVPGGETTKLWPQAEHVTVAPIDSGAIVKGFAQSGQLICSMALDRFSRELRSKSR